MSDFWADLYKTGWQWEEFQVDPGGMRPARLPVGTKLTHTPTGFTIICPPTFTRSRVSQRHFLSVAMEAILEDLNETQSAP